jgi:hypothetical protein
MIGESESLLKYKVCTLISYSFFSGGAGGKGTWGKLGCELELPWVDPNDPNYESDKEEVSIALWRTGACLDAKITVSPFVECQRTLIDRFCKNFVSLETKKSKI